MIREVPVAFPCGELALEGLLRRADPGEERGAAVVCHPHPQYGGAMDNSVVVALAGALGDAGFSTLRFNFRGVGGSGGRYGHDGEEREDVRAALRWLGDQTGPGTPLLVAGYSFGAWVGFPVACEYPGVAAVLCVAPPLDLLPMSPTCAANPVKWFALGARDEFCSLASFEAWYRMVAEPKQMLILPDADHFLWGREREVASAAAVFAAGSLARQET